MKKPSPRNAFSDGSTSGEQREQLIQTFRAFLHTAITAGQIGGKEELATPALALILRCLPPLTKRTANEWAEKGVVPLVLAEPQRHFRFSDEGITSEIVAACRWITCDTSRVALARTRLMAAKLPIACWLIPRKAGAGKWKRAAKFSRPTKTDRFM